MPHLRLEIEPAVTCAASSDAVDGLVAAVVRQIKDRLNFQAEVIPVAVDSLPRFEMKGRRFVRES